MFKSYAQTDETVQAFHQWRHSSDVHLSGFGGPAFETGHSFIPRSHLEEYFDRPRRLENLLDVVLDASKRPEVDPNLVRLHYPRCFATLLCIGEGSMVSHFYQHESLRDEKLPFRARPAEFPTTSPDKFKDFQDAQWQFCAVNLEYSMNGHFKRDDIVPIIHREKIGEGGSAIVYKIVVDQNYHSLRPPSHATADCRQQYKNTFVMKTYREAEAENNYKAERNAHMKLRWNGNPSPHIIACYGGFVHGNLYNLILEYADGGTLESFMRKTKPPSTIKDVLFFWDRLSDITHGIMCIHQTSRNESSPSQRLNGWHQDVKPINILVFGGNGTSPYDCEFKIADLDLAHFKPSDSLPNEPSDLDAFGTRAYGAPETFRFHKDLELVPLKVPQSVDIWSLGCIFSEVSVWLHDGWKRVVQYRRQRSEEVERKGGGSGEYIFHHDDSLLESVRNIHSDMMNKDESMHKVTRQILDHVVDEMLQQGSRPDAKLVFEKTKRQIKRTRDQFEVPEPKPLRNIEDDSIESHRSTAQVHPMHVHPHSQSYPGTRPGTRLTGNQPLPPDDHVSVSSGSSKSVASQGHHLESKDQSNKKHRNDATENPQSVGTGSHAVLDSRFNPSKAANTHGNFEQQEGQKHQKEPERPTLSIREGHAWKDKKKKHESPALHGSENLTSLDRRNHIFLVYNSKTMKPHRRDVDRVISLLAYMLKSSDADGLDMYFAHSWPKINTKKSSRLSREIFKAPFEGISDMRLRLQQILQEHPNKFEPQFLPRKNFLGHQPGPQPQRPLSFYILTDAKWQPTDVGSLIKDLAQEMIDKKCAKEQLAIQFIRFGEDEASIAKLDKLDSGLGLKAKGMDFVDHTYRDGNVWKQLLGAINDWYDDDAP